MAIIALEPKYEGYLISKKAEEEGLVAIGGHLSVKSLLCAYSSGIFPWYAEGKPIMWWSPDPRTILIPEKFKPSHSLRQLIKQRRFRITCDTAFREVVHHCGIVPRKGQDGTWITPEVKKAYHKLHKAGYAHSFETWLGDRFVGGLYGVSLGRAFFGESMFYLENNASKVAMYYLVEFAKCHGFLFIDAQIETTHLLSLRAENIPRREFLAALHHALQFPTLKGEWRIPDEK